MALTFALGIIIGCGLLYYFSTDQPSQKQNDKNENIKLKSEDSIVQ